MNKYLLPFLLLFICFQSIAQKKAVTDAGEEVVLYDNGTWKYVKEPETEKKEIIVNPSTFTKPKSADFLVKSTKAKIGIWIDAKKWQFKKASNNEEAEFEFKLKSGDLYGMLISEKIEIPIETLKKVALDNAQKAAPDIVLVKEEYRTVNNKKVLLMQMNGTLNGIKFSYYGYYFAFPGGTVQLITYTSQSLLKDYLASAEELLNGLVTID